jgi:thiamine kinase-like enzyme
VCQYLSHDENQQQSEVDVAELLRQIHALPPVHHRIDLRQRIRQYLHQLEAQHAGISAVLSSITSHTETIIHTADATDTTLVVCHNDLLAANRLRSNGRLYALDWEYSGMGHRWFDLAVICEGEGDDSVNANSLLDAYLERNASVLERETLVRFRLCYRYLAWLWHAVCDQQPISEHNLAALNAELAPALAQAVTGTQR